MQESNQGLKNPLLGNPLLGNKTKIVEKIVRFELFLTVIGQNYVKVTNRKTFQNKIFQNLILRNKHVVTNHLIFKKLRNCAKL